MNDVELLRRRLVRIRDDAKFEDWRRDTARSVLAQLDDGTLRPSGIRKLLRATRPVDDLPKLVKPDSQGEGGEVKG